MPRDLKKMVNVMEIEMVTRFDGIENKLEYAETTALDPRFKKNAFQFQIQNFESYNEAERSI